MANGGATSSEASASFRRVAILVWSVLGVAGLLIQALVRLTPVALEPLTNGQLSLFEAALYLGWLAFNAWAEGYRAFQLRFCPRVIARAAYLSNHPHALSVLLGPAFAMGLFRAPRRRVIVSWLVVAAITAAVIVVRHLPQPYRGIIDGGVVVGLGWGVIVLIVMLLRALRGEVPELPQELPEAGDS